MGSWAHRENQYELAERLHRNACVAVSPEDLVAKMHCDSQLAVSLLEQRKDIPWCVEALRKLAFDSLEKSKTVIPPFWINYMTSLIRSPRPLEAIVIPDEVRTSLENNADFNSGMATAWGMIGNHDLELAYANNMAAVDRKRLHQAAMVKMKCPDEQYTWEMFADDYSFRPKPFTSEIIKPIILGDSGKPRKVLVAAEQGLGDLIMIGKSFNWMKSLNWDVSFYSSRDYERNFVVDCISGCNKAVGPPVLSSDYDFVINLMDLLRYAHLWNTDSRLFDPYLEYEPDHFITDGKVGVNFTGNPKFEFEFCRGVYDESVRTDIRSMVDNISGSIVELSDHGKLPLDRFASLVSGLKAVVTTDTMIAHMAGSIGVPCLVMLAVNSDWRWSYPWYGENFHVVQQKEIMKWGSVMPDVREFLEMYAYKAD